MGRHGGTDVGAAPGKSGNDRGPDWSVRFLLHAAANARCCVQDLAELRARGMDTVRLLMVTRVVLNCYVQTSCFK